MLTAEDAERIGPSDHRMIEPLNARDEMQSAKDTDDAEEHQS